MSAVPDDPSLWKQPGAFLLKYIKEEVGLTIAGFVLWKKGPQLWDWITQSIAAYPAQTICVVAVVTTLIFARLWAHWRWIAKLALERASRVSGLESSLTKEKSKCATLEVQVAKQSAVQLTEQERHILTCVLCLGRATIHNIVNETGSNHTQVTSAITKLRYGLQLINRVGQQATGEEVFSVTEDKGLAYARTHGILAINQSHEEMVRTQAEKNATDLAKIMLHQDEEIKRLKQEKASVEAQLEAARKERESLSGGFAKERQETQARIQEMTKQLDVALKPRSLPGGLQTPPMKPKISPKVTKKILSFFYDVKHPISIEGIGEALYLQNEEVKTHVTHLIGEGLVVAVPDGYMAIE